MEKSKQVELFKFVEDNDIAQAKALIDLDIDVNSKNAAGTTAYLLAASLGRYEILKYMLEHAKIDYSVRDAYGASALILATKAGKLKSVQLLLKASEEDIDNQDDLGFTALTNIVIVNDRSQVFPKIAKLLLVNGANAGLQDKKYKTVIEYAKENDYVEIIELLLTSRSAYVNF
ncbi:MAG: ankyrin repeat domain-containing protein [Erysipelothrix sp.]|nr:ankyrin repeat domain-containing protein [Erysipelothrix sp.]